MGHTARRPSAANPRPTVARQSNRRQSTANRRQSATTTARNRRRRCTGVASCLAEDMRKRMCRCGCTSTPRGSTAFVADEMRGAAGHPTRWGRGTWPAGQKGVATGNDLRVWPGVCPTVRSRGVGGSGALAGGTPGPASRWGSAVGPPPPHAPTGSSRGPWACAGGGGGGMPRPSTNGSSMPQHAAACRSARFWELLVGVLKHAAACRSEAKFSHGGLFFHNMSNL